MKYEETLSRAKGLIDGMKEENVDATKEDIKNLFPGEELEENENERVRKNCIHFLELQKKHHAATFEIDECIAWLEKQGEQKPDFCHHEVDLSNCSEEYRKAYYDGWNNCNQQHEQMKNQQKPTWSEEDKENISMLIDLVESKEESMEVKIELSAWLKSLKERVQPQPTK